MPSSKQEVFRHFNPILEKGRPKPGGVLYRGTTQAPVQPTLSNTNNPVFPGRENSGLQPRKVNFSSRHRLTHRQSMQQQENQPTKTESNVNNHHGAEIELPKVDRITGTYVDDSGHKWSSLGHISKKYGIDSRKLKGNANSTPSILGTIEGKTRTLYRCDLIIAPFQNHISLPDIHTEGTLSDESGLTWISISEIHRRYPEVAPITIRSHLKKADVASQYAKSSGRRTIVYEEAGAVRTIGQLATLPKVEKKTGTFKDGDDELASIPYFCNTYQLDHSTVKRLLDGLPKRDGRDSVGKQTKFYPISQTNELLSTYISLPKVHQNTNTYIDPSDKEWAPVQSVVTKTGLSRSLIEAKIEEYKIVSITGRDISGIVTHLYALSELLGYIEPYLSLPRVQKRSGIFIDPEGQTWAAIPKIAKMLNLSRSAAGDRLLNSSSSIRHIEGIDNGGRLGTLWNITDAIDYLRNFATLPQIGTLRNSLVDFIQSLSKGGSPESRQFAELTRIFGASNYFDILLTLRPEYKGLIKNEDIESVIADYLGDFLVQPQPFSIVDIDVGLPYIANINFQYGLYEVLKDSCLRYFLQRKREGTPESSAEIIEGYLLSLDTTGKKHNNPDLTAIIQRVSEFYRNAMYRIQSPPRMIEALRENRDFPDIGQRINSLEIENKKRMLIADDRGMGKSATVIHTKERLEINCAVIIAPSNVIASENAWRDYLSDRVAGDGKQIGYFKSGQAPNVFIVENLEALANASTSPYDYILIAQEKLTDRYVEALEKIDFDMLVVDEIHKLKNIRHGVRAAGLVRLARKIEQNEGYLVMLSATPTPNRVKDAAIILRLLHPDKFGEMDTQTLIHYVVNADLLQLRSLLMPHLQMKSLAEGLDMPALHEHTVELELSRQEQRVYEALIEEDELTGREKLKLLRQFCLNPQLLDTTPGIPKTKIQAVAFHLNEVFQQRNKVVMYVNDYIEGILRGDQTIIGDLNLPADIVVCVIDGETDLETRRQIQKDLNESNQKMLVLVSGQTADVGVDFSGGEHVDHYNEPWTLDEKRQQIGRVHRPGVRNDIDSHTFILRGTIEEGIHRHILLKAKAIKKLLYGIPRTELEQQLLKQGEKDGIEKDLEVNPDLARGYASPQQRLRKMLAVGYEMGEDRFSQFLQLYGDEYANRYRAVEARNYQANGARIVGTMIDAMVREQEQNPSELFILDVASGPQILEKHILQEYQERVISTDINPHHFDGNAGKQTVSSLSALPFANKSCDYVNLSFALHYTRFVPSQGIYERLQVLQEINRVLKPGGRAIFNFVHSQDLKNVTAFHHIAATLGFRVVEEYSGQVQAGHHYESRVFTLEKVIDVQDDSERIVERIGNDNSAGLKFERRNKRLKDTRKVVTSFELSGRQIAIKLNELDEEILVEEEAILAIGEGLKAEFGSIKNIPRDYVIDNDFIRIKVGNYYILLRKMTTQSSFVVVR